MNLERIADWLQGLEEGSRELPADLVAWAAPQAVDGRLQIGCNGGGVSRRVPGGAELPCLGALTWRDLVRFRGAGVTDLVLVLRQGGCAGCPGGLAEPPAFGVPVRYATAWERVEARQADADRRALLFGALEKRLAERRTAPPDTAGPVGPAPDLLAAGIATLPPEHRLPLAAPLIRPGCTFCGGCANLCEAFSLTPGRLTWRAPYCGDCGRCEALCPAGVIARSESVTAGTWAAPRVVAQAEERICACGEPYYNSDPEARCLRCTLLGDGSEAHGYF